MGREQRVYIPTGTYHVTICGNNGEPLFTNLDDRMLFDDLIAEGVERFGHQIHAFSCGESEVEFIIQVFETSLSEIMHNLCLRYAKTFNHRHDRSGHFFGKRYDSKVTQPGKTYLMELLRRIHRLPEHPLASTWPEEYSHSSLAAYQGKTQIPWLTTGVLLAELSPDLGRARSSFRALVERSDERHPPRLFRHGSALDSRFIGSEKFIKEILASLRCLRVGWRTRLVRERDGPEPFLGQSALAPGETALQEGLNTG